MPLRMRRGALRGLAAGCALAALLAAPSRATAASAAPPRVHRVLLISIDGLRPDVLLRARTPSLRALMARGTFTMWARTTALSTTLPSHASMLTGVSPARHGIVWNTDLPLLHAIFPLQPTLFEVARRAGMTTAMAAAKSKFSALVKPGTLDWSLVPPPDMQLADRTVTDTAAAWIATHAPQVLFVHLGDVDSVGHTRGWGSPAQVRAVETADACVGRLLEALRRQRLLDQTAILVTADHGGAGLTHGPDDPRSRTIPWILAGPGIHRDLDLTTVDGLEVRTEDTFATLCAMLGLDLPGLLDGRPVVEAFAAPK